MCCFSPPKERITFPVSVTDRVVWLEQGCCIICLRTHPGTTMVGEFILYCTFQTKHSQNGCILVKRNTQINTQNNSYHVSTAVVYKRELSASQKALLLKHMTSVLRTWPIHHWQQLSWVGLLFRYTLPAANCLHKNHPLACPLFTKRRLSRSGVVLLKCLKFLPWK